MRNKIVSFTHIIFLSSLSFVSGRWPSGLDPSPGIRGNSCGVRAWWWVGPLSHTVLHHNWCWLSVVFHPLIHFNSLSLSFPGISQKIWHWRQPLWDHHLRWDSLLPPSCYSWRKTGVDQRNTGSVKDWKIAGAVAQLDLLVVKSQV